MLILCRGRAWSEVESLIPSPVSLDQKDITLTDCAWKNRQLDACRPFLGTCSGCRRTISSDRFHLHSCRHLESDPLYPNDQVIPDSLTNAFHHHPTFGHRQAVAMEPSRLQFSRKLRFPVIGRPGYQFKARVLRQRSFIRDFTLGQCPVPRGHNPIKSVKPRRPLLRISESQTSTSVRKASSSSFNESHTSSIQRAAMVRAARLHYQQRQPNRSVSTASIPSVSPTNDPKWPRMRLHSSSQSDSSGNTNQRHSSRGNQGTRHSLLLPDLADTTPVDPMQVVQQKLTALTRLRGSPSSLTQLTVPPQASPTPMGSSVSVAQRAAAAAQRSNTSVHQTGILARHLDAFPSGSRSGIIPLSNKGIRGISSLESEDIHRYPAAYKKAPNDGDLPLDEFSLESRPIFSRPIVDARQRTMEQSAAQRLRLLLSTGDLSTLELETVPSLPSSDARNCT